MGLPCERLELSLTERIEFPRADGPIETCGVRPGIVDAASLLLEQSVTAGSGERLVPASLLSCFLEAIKDPFVAIDRNWRIIYLNRVAAVASRGTFDSLVGKLCWDVWPDVLGTQCEDRYRTAMESGHPIRFEQYRPPIRAWFEVTAVSFEGGLGVVFRNITDRKRAESDATFQSQLTKAIADHALEAIFLVDAEGRTTFANQAAVAMFDYSNEELIGSILSEKIRDGSDVGKDDVDREAVFYGKNDKPVYVHCSTGAIVEDGEKVGSVLVVHNITERKRTQHERDTALILFERIAEATPNVLFIFDVLESKLVYANSQILQHLGYTPEEVIEMGSDAIPSLCHPDDLFDVSEALERVQADDQEDPVEVEIRLRHRDGVFRWIHLRSVPFSHTEDGKVNEVLGVATDVTAAHEIEEALRRSERDFRVLADTMPQIVWVSEVGVGTIFLNRRYYEYTGLDPVVPGEKGWELVVHPEDREDARRTYQKAMATQSVWEREIRLKNAQGYYRWHLSRSIPMVDSEGRITHWFGTSTDIHERRTLNDELESRVAERTAELVRANRELEEYTYAMSHDLRGPVRAIISLAEIIKTDHSQSMSQEVRDLLDRQTAAAKKLNSLVNDILHVHRVSRQEIAKTSVDLSAMAQEVGNELQRTDWGHPVSLTVEPGLVLDCDPRLMRIAVTSLLENAFKFAKKDGAKVRVEKADHGFAVHDEGIGFEMEYAEKIFLPFERLHRPHEFAGTGIGLANVKRIVERHNCKIEVQSTPNQGSTFTIKLP
jgi:PAS domain S-box-containing protein